MYFTDKDGHTYPAPKHIREIDGYKIVTWERDVTSANILTVETGTNGYQGGDSNHGSRTFVRIEDTDSTNIRCSVEKDCFGHMNSLEITLGGDTELETFIDALKWIASILEVQTNSGVIS